MNEYKYVIVGGGMVAGYAAQEFAERNVEPGEVAIISAEPALPYERPPLSKGYLADEMSLDEILINSEDFYEENGFDVFLETRVVDVDFDNRELSTDTGRTFSFQKLLLATGASPRRLSVKGGTSEGVYYLRSAEDSRRIREAVPETETAVVVGGGFIGMEVASVLARSGLKTRLAYRSEHLMEGVFSPEIWEFFEDYFHRNGVRLEAGAEVAEIQENRNVRFSSGLEIPSDLVVVGIGVEPNTHFLRDSGLQLRDGIVTNEYLETGLPNVYAAGDVARYLDKVFQKARRTEHWDNAVEQGRYAVRRMTGLREPFVHVPYFFSDVFDLSYEFWGDPSDAEDVVVRGDRSTGSFSVWWLRQGHLVAAFVMGRPEEEREVAPKWIRLGLQVPVSLLADEGSSLADLEGENETPFRNVLEEGQV